MVLFIQHLAISTTQAELAEMFFLVDSLAKEFHLSCMSLLTLSFSLTTVGNLGLETRGSLADTHTNFQHQNFDYYYIY